MVRRGRKWENAGPFYVIRWDDREVIGEFETLTRARKFARGQGHSCERNAGGKTFAPRAFVAVLIEVYGQRMFGCVYNPMFRTATWDEWR
jgi:hypothetical protein